MLVFGTRPEAIKMAPLYHALKRYMGEFDIVVWVIDQIKIAVADASAKTGRKPEVACLGLAFKPDIDDSREPPALYVAKSLQAQGYEVMAVEPNIDRMALLH